MEPLMLRAKIFQQRQLLNAVEKASVECLPRADNVLKGFYP